MKTKITTLAICAVVVALAATLPQQTPQGTPFAALDQPQTDNATVRTHQKPFYDGVITIKVKQSIGRIAPQDGQVVFGISSLDEKASKFEVNAIAGRFKHRPIPRNSDLPDLSRIYRLSFPERYAVDEVVRAFASDPNIEYAEPIYIRAVADEPDDPLYNQLQHLPQIMAPDAWDIHKGENGTTEVVVGIIDTGTDWQHEDLCENTWQNTGEDADHDGQTLEFTGGQWILDPGDLNGIDDDGNGYIDDLIGWDFYEWELYGNGSDPDPVPGDPYYDHGTHVAGIAASCTHNGTGISSISWNIKYMAVQSFGPTTEFYGFDAIIYAAEQGADVISNSWGGGGYSEAEAEVISYVTGLGSIIVAAAHNYDNEEIMYPASYPGVISVAAVASNDQKTYYSSYGAAVDVSGPGGDRYVDGGILSTVMNNAYDRKCGTSMSTPLVSGLMALVKSLHPEWTPWQVMIQVVGTADNIDAINPDYTHKLGSGRINAFRALDETGVTAPEELRVLLLDYIIHDENGNDIIEPGETVDLDFSFMNYSMYDGGNTATFTLLSNDPEVSVLNGTYMASLLPDDTFEVEEMFRIQVCDDPTPHMCSLSIHLDADIPVTCGEEMEFEMIVAPEGILVYDGHENGEDYSGGYIKDFLNYAGVPVMYTDRFPKSSLITLDGIFLSFGNHGSGYTCFSPEIANRVEEYLYGGGNVYLEGGDALGYDQAGNETLLTLFGLSSVIDGPQAPRPVTHLAGQTNALTEGMLFTGSTQSGNEYIDKYFPNENGMVAFVENTVGNVAVQGEGDYGQKTFCFSYALGKLLDNGALSQRNKLLLNVIDFFGIPMPEGYLVSNFLCDTVIGLPGLVVQFNDLSLSDPAHPITSWEWDFENDGETDSWLQHPVWVFPDAALFTVRLVTSNGIRSDTLIKENLINTVSYKTGTLTKEGSPYMPDYDIIVPQDETLILEPGVEIRFQGHYQFIVHGRILAIGQETDSIRITADDHETGWHHMIFSELSATSDTSILSYCILEYGKPTGHYPHNFGGAILIGYNSKIIISNCLITHNTATYNEYYPGGGGGISIGYCNPIIRNCVISHNTAMNGAGIILGHANPLIEHNRFIGNHAMEGQAGAIYGTYSSPLIRYNLICDNISNQFGGAFSFDYSTPILINNTIVNNAASAGGGALECNNSSNPVIRNCIFWNNQAPDGMEVCLTDHGSDPDFYYNDIEGGMEGFGGWGSGANFNGDYEECIDDDPLFVEPEAGNYYLTEESPCIDTGDPDPQYNDPDGSRNDMGAFYFFAVGIDGHKPQAAGCRLEVFPNPASGTVVISHQSAVGSHQSLSVHDLNGKKIMTLVDGYQAPGEYKLVLDTSGLPAGIYFIRLQAGDAVDVERMVVVR